MNRRRRAAPSHRLALYCYHHWQLASRTLGDLWRSPLTTLLTLAVIGVSLALPATFFVMLKNAEAVTSQWEGGTRITLFLQKGLDDDRLTALQTRVGGYPEVGELRYISPQQAMAEFNHLSGFSGALKLLAENPLPPVLEVMLRPESRNASSANALLERLEQEPEVEQAKLDLQWLSRLDGITSLIRHSIHAFGGLLLLGVVLTVANTLRLNVLGRRAEIEVMKLVGATDGFILRPFLYLGFWYGLIGGLLAWWLSEILVLWSENLVRELAILFESQFRLLGLGSDGLWLPLLGAGLGMSAAWLSVHRHIRDMEP